MRELTLQELDEVSGGWELSFSGMIDTIVGTLAFAGASALGIPVIPAALIAGLVVFAVDNYETFMEANEDLWRLELEYARMTLS